VVAATTTSREPGRDADTEEGIMRLNSPDRLNLRLWIMLATLGAILCLIGWYRYFHLAAFFSR
jgi:hypothetical protein